MKKFISLLLCVLLIMGSSFSLACNQEQGAEANVFIVSTNTVDLYDTLTLQTYEGIDDEQVQWSSSNKKVLTVENGVVSALALGEATITATYGGKKQSERITVSSSEQSLPNIILDDTYLLNGESIILSPSVEILGKQMQGVSFEYSLVDTDIAEYKNGLVVSKTIGETKLTVNAYWKGVKVATKTVNCVVCSNTGIYADQHAYTLYVSHHVRNVPFAKTINVSSKVYQDGVVIDEGANVSWEVADSKVATINSNGLLTAVSVGKTTIKGTYTEGNKTIKTVDIPVSVEIPVLETNINVIVDMNKSIINVDGRQVLNEGDIEVGKIVDANDNTLYTENGLLSTEKFELGEYRCVVYNSDQTYAVVANFVCANLIVRTPEDLDTISAKENLNKYIVLANDIDYDNGKYASHGAHTDIENYFTGTFNGLGHSITNLVMKNSVSGLFKGTRGGTFKNFGMEVNLNKGNQAALFYWFRETPVIIDNVYLDVTIDGSSEVGGGYRVLDANNNVVVTGSAGICTHGLNSSLKLSNTIIRIRNNGDEGMKEICGAIMAYSAYGTALFDNCFAITEDFTISGVSKNSNNRFSSAMNKTPNVIYENDQAFESARKKEGSVISLDGFNEFWQIPEAGVPIFSSMK